MTKNEDCAAAAVRPLIIIMAKVPTPGAVKTRLTPLLSPTQAAQIATAFLQDTLKNARVASPHVMIAYAPVNGEIKLRKILAPASESATPLWLAQRGADLGARLNAATAHGFALGFSPVLLIGADSPTLPPHFLQNAITILARKNCDVVLGPTQDGGYYLLGLNAMQRHLHRNVAWSTPDVLAQTKANAEKLNLRVEFLPEWHDVDTPADLQKLNDYFQHDESAQNVTPQTFTWLLENQFLTDK